MKFDFKHGWKETRSRLALSHLRRNKKIVFFDCALGAVLSFAFARWGGYSAEQARDAYEKTTIATLLLALAISLIFLAIYYGRPRWVLAIRFQKVAAEWIDRLLCGVETAILVYVGSLLYFYLIYEPSPSILVVPFYLYMAENIRDALNNWRGVSLINPYVFTGEELLRLSKKMPKDEKRKAP